MEIEEDLAGVVVAVASTVEEVTVEEVTEVEAAVVEAVDADSELLINQLQPNFSF